MSLRAERFKKGRPALRRDDSDLPPDIDEDPWARVIDAEFAADQHWCLWVPNARCGMVPDWLRPEFLDDYVRERVCWALAGEPICPTFGIPRRLCAEIERLVFAPILICGHDLIPDENLPEDLDCEHYPSRLPPFRTVW